MSQTWARGHLLDTHTLIWALKEPERLSATACAAVRRGPNVLSVVSYWEIMLKSMKGALGVGDPRTWWQDALNQLAAAALPLRPAHVNSLRDLPPIHKDPFERMLIAQATVEGLALVSMDANAARYASANLRVIG